MKVSCYRHQVLCDKKNEGESSDYNSGQEYLGDQQADYAGTDLRLIGNAL